MSTTKSQTDQEVDTGLPVEQGNAEQPRQEKPKLNKKNWLNLAFYLLNVLFTIGIGNAGWVGNGNNGELSRKYQTLITPNSSAFSIWGVIFVFQAIFSIAQLLPRYRATPMVQQGVSYWYMLACTFQIAWTFAFAYEIIWLALVFILLIWLSLCALVYTQYYTESDGTRAEFWLLRFPFSIHCGWLTAASVLNVNLVAVDANAPADAQLALGIVSLAYLHAVSVWVLFGLKRNPNYTIAGVLAWAFGWIYNELQDPQQKIVETFDQDIISGVSYAALAVAIIVTLQIVVRFGMYVVTKYFYATSESDDAGQEAEHHKPASSEDGTDEEQDLVDVKV